MAHKTKKVRKKKSTPTKNLQTKKTTKRAPIRKFALFDVGKEKYCIDLDNITEVLHIFEIVPAEHLPESFAGITRLHGKSIPVIDMHKLLSEETCDGTTHTCVLTKVRSSPIGLLVDSDVTIATSRKGRLLPLPDCFTKEEAEFLEGIFWFGDSLYGILKPQPMVASLARWRVKK